MKPYYYLAQALLELRHTTEALQAAHKAYQFCLETKDASTEILSRFILRAKQAHWQTKETARLREINHTLGLVEDLLQQRYERDLEDIEQRFKSLEVGETGRSEERIELEKELEERRKIVRAAFTDSTNKDTSERVSQPDSHSDIGTNKLQVVPDYLIDTITFEVMHDPVITPSGQSYERVGLLKHIRNAGVDPLTREPLTEKQLVPNVALRVACSEFLENNGWAVDY